MEFIMNEVKVDEIAVLEDTETPIAIGFGCGGECFGLVCFGYIAM